MCKEHVNGKFMYRNCPKVFLSCIDFHYKITSNEEAITRVEFATSEASLYILA
uniref:Uncharacterized protein n=1 Tax=Ascaris lumbricoides TaxID=6252 RepID=A0A0M3IW21_ASCLU